MNDRELMQQALEALEKTTSNTISQAARIQEAITALRERLAQPEQEPVAWANLNDLTEQFNLVNCGTAYRLPGDGLSPLYTAPPQRKPLTEREPVAWRFRETKNKQWSISDDGYYISCKRTSGYIIEPLYTTPPHRKPLTEEGPVAYVTGFSKGYAVVEPVDRSLLMCVGMALYRSPSK